LDETDSYGTTVRIYAGEGLAEDVDGIETE
jgi:hypothetical protein